MRLHAGVVWTLKRVCTKKLTMGENSFATSGTQTCVSIVPWLFSWIPYQLSYHCLEAFVTAIWWWTPLSLLALSSTVPHSLQTHSCHCYHSNNNGQSLQEMWRLTPKPPQQNSLFFYYFVSSSWNVHICVTIWLLAQRVKGHQWQQQTNKNIHSSFLHSQR